LNLELNLSSLSSNEALVKEKNIPSQKEDSSTHAQNKIEHFISLKGFLEECRNFEEALEVLNSEGVKHNLSFKRGNIHYHSKDIPKDKRIICSKALRNKSKSTQTQSKDKKSIDNLSLKSNQVFDCPVYYKFSFDEETLSMSLTQSNETHNHDLTSIQERLTENMIAELQTYSKNSKVIEIKESLEKKFSTKVNYQQLYYEFRKIFPRFGKDDANNLRKILEEKKLHINLI